MRYVYVVIIIVLLLNISGHFKVAFIFGEVAITIYMLHSLYVIIKEIINSRDNTFFIEVFFDKIKSINYIITC